MFLYELAMQLYGGLLRIVALWHPKARLWVEGRKDWRRGLREKLAEAGGAVVWFHCASLGEFEQGRPVMEGFLDKFPNYKLVVSFFSPSGYVVRKNYDRALAVCYLPLDSKRNAQDFLDIVKPECVFFVKYEFWYNYLSLLQRRRVPTFLVSAIFRPSQLFFKPLGGFYRSWLRSFSQIYTQDEASKSLLESVGIGRVVVAGDSRFDRVYSAALRAEDSWVFEVFSKGAKVLIAGSTWPADEELLLAVVNELPAGWKFILVPHEIDCKRIQHWLSRVDGAAVQYSQKPTPESLAVARVMIVDIVGILQMAYRYASIAYVGGGFGVGIHNTLEPAAYGLPVVFGPNYGRFKEAVELIQCRGGVAIRGKEELQTALSLWMKDEAERRECGAQARRYVEEHIGATGRVLSSVAAIVGES